jgi:PAS domain S-box-containing protein
MRQPKHCQNGRAYSSYDNDMGADQHQNIQKVVSEGKKDMHHDSDHLYRIIVESAKDFAIFTMDLDGAITTWNTGAERIFGFSRGEMIGKDTSLIFTSEDDKHDIPEQEINDALTKGHARDERWHIRKDGSRFWADGLLMPLRDTLGATHGFLKILRDRTDLREIEETLHSKEREIRLLQDEITALKKKN